MQFVAMADFVRDGADGWVARGGTSGTTCRTAAAVPSGGGENGMTSGWILGALEEIRSETGKRGRRRLLH